MYAGYFLRRTAALVRAHPWPCLAAWLAMVLPSVTIDAGRLIVLPLVVGEGLGVREALGTSWRRMGLRIAPAMVAVTAIFAPVALLCLGMLSVFGLDSPLPLWVVLASDLVAPTCMVGAWALAVAAHLLLAPPDLAAGTGAAPDASYMPPAGPA